MGKGKNKMRKKDKTREQNEEDEKDEEEEEEKETNKESYRNLLKKKSNTNISKYVERQFLGYLCTKHTNKIWRKKKRKVEKLNFNDLAQRVKPLQGIIMNLFLVVKSEWRLFFFFLLSESLLGFSIFSFFSLF